MSCHKTTLSDERVMELFWCIPDHELNDSARKYMTEDLFNTLEESFSIPPAEPGYIGDEEFLGYFIHGNGGYPSADERDVQILTCSLQDKTHAEARLLYQYWGESYIHRLSLVRENGKWILDDFDGKKARCKEYNRSH